jgi:two-component system response regulator HydG
MPSFVRCPKCRAEVDLPDRSVDKTGKSIPSTFHPTVLLVSGDSSLVEACEGVVGSIRSLRLDVLPGILQVYPRLQEDEVALILIHLLPTSDPEEVISLLHALATTKRAVATLAVAEQHDPTQALDLLRAGVADYLSRPLDLGRLAYLIDALTARVRYAGLQAVPRPRAAASQGPAEPILNTRSAAMAQMMEQVRLVAPQDTTLLLGGETGTGKTRLARLIHELSPRRADPFLVINCGALATNLIESEMFGHVKGAFTGADRDRSGKFADVRGGTLVLDEIDALPLASQAKLLRVIEERVFEPVGSNKSQPVRARLIAASNRPLDKEIEAGRFRSDLYYRLNVVQFYLPPLRERPSEIAQLANAFVGELAGRKGRPVQSIAEEALYALEAYDWPGNIRELRNVVERAVALCPGNEIQLGDLPEGICRASPGMAIRHSGPLKGSASAASLSQVKREAEAARIADALKRHGNNRLRAAADLGISRMTLYQKLHKYGLTG